MTRIPLASAAAIKCLSRILRAEVRAEAGAMVRVRIGNGSQRGFVHVGVGIDAPPALRASVAAFLAADGWVCGVNTAPRPGACQWTVRPLHWS
jgi:hypothetical protein